MIEFALSVSALLLVIFGILEFARAMYTYHTVSNAARLASRWAIVRGAGCTAPLDHCGATSGDIATWVRANVPVLDADALTVSAAWSTTADPSADCTQTDPTGNNAQGHVVCVTVAEPFDFVVPFVSGGARPTISSTSRMVISN